MRIRLLIAAFLLLLIDFGLSRALPLPFPIAITMLLVCWGLLLAARAWPVVLLMATTLISWRSDPVPTVVIDKAKQSLTVHADLPRSLRPQPPGQQREGGGWADTRGPLSRHRSQ